MYAPAIHPKYLARAIVIFSDLSHLMVSDLDVAPEQGEG
jgi:hypothetical protein